MRALHRFHFPKSLRFRLLLLVLLATLPAVILVIFTGIQQRQLAAEGEKQEALRVARLAANRQQGLIEGARQLLVAIAQLPQIRDQNGTECSHLMSELQQHYVNYASLGVIRPNGDVYCSSVEENRSVNLADRSYFQDVLSTHNFMMGGYTVDRLSGLVVIPFAYPVLDQNNQLQAVVLATVRTDWLYQLVSTLNLPDGVSMFIVDHNGIIMARYPNPDLWVGKGLPDASLIHKILATNGEGTAELPGVDGVMRLNAFTSLTGDVEDKAFINVGIPIDIAYAGANQALAANLLGLSLITLLALGAAWLLGEYFIARRIRLLALATHKISAGNLSARTGIPYDGGEVGDLAQSFDAMASSLQEREVQLGEAEARYRTLIEQVPAITYTSSLDGKILYVSPQVEDILGFTTQEWLADPDPYLAHVVPEDLPRVQTELGEARQTHGNFRSEYRMIARDKHEVWVRDDATLVKKPSGDPLLRQGIMVDISGLKEVEAALEGYAHQLELTNRELQDFAYIASHDLQEPLRKIQAFGERLELKFSDQLGEMGKDYIARMRNSAARMQSLINDLLSYSRVETRGKPFVETDLNDVIQEVLTNLETRLEETKGTVRVDDIPPFEADPTQMYQLFLNLIGNGLKFHRDGTPPVVDIRCENLQNLKSSRQKTIEITVQDNGIGFDEKYLDRIFQPFQRLHSREEYEGSGIGLAICRKIVERHHGTIAAHSKPGEGAVFIITLPIQQSLEKGERI